MPQLRNPGSYRNDTSFLVEEIWVFADACSISVLRGHASWLPCLRTDTYRMEVISILFTRNHRFITGASPC